MKGLCYDVKAPLRYVTTLLEFNVKTLHNDVMTPRVHDVITLHLDSIKQHHDIITL